MTDAGPFADTLIVGTQSYTYYPVHKISGAQSLPYSLTVLLENVLRNVNDADEVRTFADRIISAGTAGKAGEEIAFMPARVLFQDFTGVPVFVDFAVMREACKALGGDPNKINPKIPCDLVIDHSIIADFAGCKTALADNMALEFERNKERYNFLKWAQASFENVRIVPPGQGICHQLNIEKFSSVVMSQTALAANASTGNENTASFHSAEHVPVAYFDTLVGTDSHTPTANGIGVLGWGVGGIEAEAAALGQPITTLVPRVIGVHLTGKLTEGTSAMDVALSFAHMLRQTGVVGCFVECFGEGVSSLSATQRACISNMTPEYGSTCTLFPLDENTIEFLRLTGRDSEQVALVEAYAKAQGLWHDPSAAPRTYAEVIEFDLSEVVPSMAGPSRPHDRFDIANAQTNFEKICAERNLAPEKVITANVSGATYELASGAIAIAAITSCTTATDPRMMIACGLTARNAVRAQLKPKPWVKCIFAPGSHATELLLKQAGLLDGLERLGFYNCGFGCMSCIGNSGNLHPGLHEIADQIELSAVLSSNRNFEGRISPDVSQNYLMAPAAVIAYALAGTVNFNLLEQPLGSKEDGSLVYARDIFPTDEEIEAVLTQFVTAQVYEQGSKGLFDGGDLWTNLSISESNLFSWDENSTYVRRPPYFDGIKLTPHEPAPLQNTRVLALLGDFITTDHISPAGTIALDSPAAQYLRAYGVAEEAFNTYGSRRGNHEVMMRGTFANIKIENKLVQGRTGGWSRDLLTKEIRPLFEVAMHYAESGVPAIVVAGKMYGSGSSRDWAAKGPALLGVRAVLAESFERIHRSNLIGMGIVPLQFLEGENAATLGLCGTETISVEPIDYSKGLPTPRTASVTALAPDGSEIKFKVVVRVDTPTEGTYLFHGGILQYVLRNLV